MLGERHGISPPTQRAPEAQAAERKRRRVLEALEAANTFFQSTLGSSAGAPAKDYLARRGIDENVVRRFGLGFAPDAWDGLLRHLCGRGYEVETLLDAGLVIRRKDGSGSYDRFRSRITFPIRDTAARTVSFGGRTISDSEPKYLNGPETSVYSKSRVLFRYSEVAQEIRKGSRAVIVEGYFDAVGLAARGVPAVVAVCGTALGSAHAGLLRRLTDEVVLFLDGDSAGRRAARRAMQPLIEAGLGVRVALPPEGQDPDDLARKGGLTAVMECLDGAMDMPEFLVAEAKREFDVETIRGKVSALEMILGHLVLLPSSLARAEASDRVADGLGVKDDVVREELQRAARQQRGKLKPSLVAPGTARPKFARSEAVLLRYFGGEASVRDGEVAVELAKQLPMASLSHLCKKAIERWLEARSENESWTLRQMADAISGPEAQQVLALAFESAAEPGIEEARGCLLTLREQGLKARLQAVQEEIDKTRGTDARDRLVQEMFSLGRAIQELHGAPSTG